MDVPKLYRKRFSTIEYGQKNQIWQILCPNFFQKYVHTTDTVLDVGAGYCEFINHINCQHKIALDANEEARQVRPRFLPFTTKIRLSQHVWLIRLYLLIRPAQWLLGKQTWIVAVKS